MKLRVIIADDEPLARERLRDLLKEDGREELVAECADGSQTVAAVLKHKPDLLFLDVQMPELDGFAVLSRLGEDCPPAIIFVTAYDKFALKAFEVHAVDYLLKPFDRERFQKALDHAREQLGRQDSEELGQRVRDLIADLKSRETRLDRIAIKKAGQITLLKPQEIDWIEAEDNYVNIHAGSQTHLLRETMAALEKRLPQGQFLRISRFAIVNVDRVKELQPLFHGDYCVILLNGTRLTLGRTYRDSLERLVGK